MAEEVETVQKPANEKEKEKTEEEIEEEEREKTLEKIRMNKERVGGLQERLALYKFIQSLDDNEFGLLVKELEGKHIEKGFTEKMIKKLLEDIDEEEKTKEKRYIQKLEWKRKEEEEEQKRKKKDQEWLEMRAERRKKEEEEERRERGEDVEGSTKEVDQGNGEEADQVEEEERKETEDKEKQKKEQDQKEEEQKRKREEKEKEQHRVEMIMWKEKSERTMKRLRLLKKVEENKLFSRGNLDQLTQICLAAGLPKDKVDAIFVREELPFLIEYVESLDIGKPITNEEAAEVKMTPWFKDQIAYRIYQEEWKLLGKKFLEAEKHEDIIKHIEHDHQTLYDRCYEMLHKLSGTSTEGDNWLFMKKCLYDVTNKKDIIKEVEVVINRKKKEKKDLEEGKKEDQNPMDTPNDKLLDLDLRCKIAELLNDDWKRLARHVDIENEDIDDIIKQIDSDKDNLYDKGLEMLGKLYKKEGELYWSMLKPALEAISRKDVISRFEHYAEIPAFDPNAEKREEELRKHRISKKKELKEAFRKYSTMKYEDSDDENISDNPNGDIPANANGDIPAQEPNNNQHEQTPNGRIVS